MLELMKKEYPSLSFDTIYRNLNLFEQLHILEATQIEEERIFRMACDHGHHHHLICTTCGKTKLVEVCPMDVLEQAPPGFEITGHKFEIYGICEMCGISQ
jgi:Fur family zinc uptake transcriptional regulator